MVALHPSFLELLNGRAYRPHPADPLVPLSARIPAGPVAVVSVGTRDARLALAPDARALDPASVSEVKPFRGAGALMADVRAQLRRPAGRAPLPVVLLVAGRWMVELLDGAPPLPGVERQRLLKTAPAEALGRAATPGTSHALLPHPELPGALHFTVAEAVTRPLVDAFEAEGAQVVRVQLPLLTLLERAARQAPECLTSRDVVVADHQSLLLLTVQQRAWARVRFRSHQPAERAADLARFLADRPDPAAPMTVLGGKEAVALVAGLGLRPEIAAAPWQQEEAPEMNGSLHD